MLAGTVTWAGAWPSSGSAQHFFFLQPVVAVVGLAEIVLAWLWQRARDRRSGQNWDLRP